MRLLALVMIAILLLACSKEPENFEELSKAGQTAFVNQDYYEARMYFSKALAIKVSDRDLLYFLGLSYLRDHMYDSAVFYLKRADLLYSTDREINLQLYEACIAAGDWENAKKAIGVLTKTGDPIEKYYDALAGLSLNLNDYISAYYYYRRLLEQEPENPDRYIQVANSAAEIGSVSVSIAVIDSAIEEFGPHEEFLANKGIYYATKRDYVTSENIFRSLLARDTSSIEYLHNLANSLAFQDDRSKKLEALRIYTNLAPLSTDRAWMDSIITGLKKELDIE